MAKLVASTNLEKKFQALAEEHSAKLNEMWEAVKKLSDETGVPVGPYVPQSFKDQFVDFYGEDGVDVALIRQLTNTTADDNEFWYTSNG